MLASVRRYIASSNANRGKVTVEYVLLDHVNDDMDHARELAEPPTRRGISPDAGPRVSRAQRPRSQPC